MAIIVELPRLTDTMREGTIASWTKAVGDGVEAGDELAEVETDKAVMSFESFDEGVLLKVLVQPGETVPLGTPIAILGEEGEDVSALADELVLKVSEAIAAAAAGGEVDSPDTIAQAPVAAPEPAPAPAPVEAAPAPAPAPAPAGDLSAPHDVDGRRIKASPLARRLAQQRGIDLRAVAGTGPRGRIVRRDLDGVEAPRALLSGVVGPPAADEVVRVTQMRKTIARRLVEAKQTAPHYYLTITADCDRLVDLRTELNELQDRQRISYNDLVLRACVLALARHPKVNAAWEGATIRQYGGVHLGFAVAMPEGLITPVVRNAERLGLIDLAIAVRGLAKRAREGALGAEEYTGNSFCVSNLGMFGIQEFTAVINPPAACILAVGALREEPVVRDGALAVGRRMTMTLSCDHRVVDGATGAAFLADLKAVLERPLQLVL